jgi:hypothetical protein
MFCTYFVDSKSLCCSFEFCLRADVQCKDAQYGVAGYAVSDLNVKQLRSNDNLIPACSEEDRSKKSWIMAFWGSNTTCREGLNFPYNLGSAYNDPYYPIHNLSCCSARAKRACNAPDYAPPAIKCLTTQSSIYAGFCAGKTFQYSVCAARNNLFDSKTTAFIQVI